MAQDPCKPENKYPPKPCPCPEIPGPKGDKGDKGDPGNPGIPGQPNFGQFITDDFQTVDPGEDVIFTASRNMIGLTFVANIITVANKGQYKIDFVIGTTIPN